MLQLNEIEKKYEELLNAKDKPIQENKKIQSHLKWQKAVNDLVLAEGLLKISVDNKIKELLGYSKDTTFLY